MTFIMTFSLALINFIFCLSLNYRNEFSKVTLKFLEKGQKVTRLVHGNPYTLRAEISSPEGIFVNTIKT